MRAGLILILTGVFVALSGLFLSNGYDSHEGILASLPAMGIPVTAGSERATFQHSPDVFPGEGPLVSLQRTLSKLIVRLPRPMEEYEVARILEALDEQYPDRNDVPKYFLFQRWTVVKPAFWLPFGLLLVVASAAILVGVALVLFARQRANQKANSL